MPASLLVSQIDTLEAPGPDENAVTVPVTEPVEAIVDRVASVVAARAPSR